MTTVLTREQVERIRDSVSEPIGAGQITLRDLRDLATTTLALMNERDDLARIHDAECAVLDVAVRQRLAAGARIGELTEGLRTLLDNLSLHGCCPANNCASEDADGLSGLRDPDPHSDGCAYVAARALLAPLPSGSER